jgi:hypothetical protein
LPDFTGDTIDLSALRDPIKRVRLVAGGPLYELRNPSLADLQAIALVYRNEAYDGNERMIRALMILMPDLPEAEVREMPPKQMLALLYAAQMPTAQLERYAAALFPNIERGTTATAASAPETSGATSSTGSPLPADGRPGS